MSLISPGVEVTVIDESFYTPAEPGTVPLIVVASAQDKANAAGTETAAATTKANAGKAFKLTSQRDLVEYFGIPNFEKTASSTPIHGSELNEYGLLAAYSFLGVSNSAFIVRADVNLTELVGQAFEPGANPEDGTWWVDTDSTSWGIQEWNGAPASTIGGQRFSYTAPLVLTDNEASRIEGSSDGPAPKASVGTIGDYAVVFETETDSFGRIFYKSAGCQIAGVSPGEWVLLGSQRWTVSHPAFISERLQAAAFSGGTFTINGIVVDVGSNIDDLVNDINGKNILGVYAVKVGNYVYLHTDGMNDLNGDSSRSNAIVIENLDADFDEIGFTEGTYYGPLLQQSAHTVVPRWRDRDPEPRPTGSVWVKITEPNDGARWRIRRWNQVTQSWNLVECPLYATTDSALYELDRSGGGANLPLDVLFAQYNCEENFGFDEDPEEAVFRIWRRNNVTTTIAKSIAFPSTGLPSGLIEFSIAASIPGQDGLTRKDISVDIGTPSIDTADDIATAINAAGISSIEASVTIEHEVELIHKTAGDIRISDGTNGFIGTIFATSENLYALPAAATEDWLVSSWKPLLSETNVFVEGDEPLSAPFDGQLWYNPELSEIDIMVHDGDNWVGYRNEYPATNAEGPIVAVSEPEGPFADQDLWISTADLENFPTIYRWSEDFQEWQQLDTTDQTSDQGVLFADARYGDSGETGNTAAPISVLLTSNYLDPDAPDPALYPRGMILWNLRRSGGNVKKFSPAYIDVAQDNVRFDPQNTGGQSMIDYEADRWVTASPNNEDGSGTFGRHAQRAVVIQAMKSVIDTSSEIRDEERRNFNIIAAPGYIEVMSNLVNLNIDRGLTAFVIGDVPFRLPADATSLLRWGTNENLAFDNGDTGIVTYDEYLGVFYPSGFTTDLGGVNAVVPSSHMMLRTIALSDQVSYPWFAPAGTRRGGITNATSVGYIDAEEGEFQVVTLNNGQRDTLYDMKINPITFFNGVGLVNYGQKTRARNASALDRINVARLIVYLRSQLSKLARPYIFEPNDKITRDEIKLAVESLLLELVGLRALYDFAVVCDDSNNTPTRIDRNELWVDIAIEPVKAVEFIYIPIRVKNTGEI